MDRNREARRVSMTASANGLSRRRHRTSSLRDSPEEDGPLELQETARLRDRGVKKDRDRDRDRSSRSKRRRGDRREEGGEDSSEDSVNDEEDEYDDEGGGGVRLLPPNPAAAMSHHHHHRKSFPPPATAKVFRPVQGWKPADEMIGFSVPRKARSASAKRSQECLVSGSGEQINRQNSPSPAPISPSSSNVSARKKMKPNGPKLRPPKSSTKPSSSNPEELEIEIAEVLYGMMTQTHGPSKKEIVGIDSAKFDANKLSSDGKSRGSSPISNSASTVPQSSSALPQNSAYSATPLSAVAPKRKRPRQVSENLGSFSVRNSPISSTTDLPLKTEISTPIIEKGWGSAAENGSVSNDFTSSLAVPSSSEPTRLEQGKPEVGGIEEGRESRDVGPAKEEPVTYPLKESTVVRPDNDGESTPPMRVNSTIPESESQREEKYEIDLMAPPPQLKSSPERGEIDFVAANEQKPEVRPADKDKDKDKDDEKPVKIGEGEAISVEPELKKAKVTAEEAELAKPVVSRERNIDLQLESDVNSSKLKPNVHKQEQSSKKATRDEHTEKTAQSSSLPFPMSVGSWPGGLPQMGYMTPLQGVVSIDGNAISPPIQPLFSHPRPKRCATHWYIARNIHYLQQYMKMNPFWPPSAGPASLFGAKHCNLNAVPSAELHGSNASRTLNSVQDKVPGPTIFFGHSGKDKGSQATNITDAQRKQPIFLQQALPAGAPPSNILHGPAFIFPVNQQQASVRPGSVKSPTAGGSVGSTNASSSASLSGSAAAPPPATALSFNYPNMASSETQYLAILQNNGYPFPIPAVGAPPTYRGTHAQPMPYFNGSFYSSQMIHPSQLQQQQLPYTQPQTTTISGGSSSSHKHLQRPQSSGATHGGNGSGNLHVFPTPKNRPSQVSNQARHLETEVGGEDSPSTADSRVSRPPMSVYNQNFAVPIYPQNFALMTGGVASGGGSQAEKKQPTLPQQQQLGLNSGVESLSPQSFAMSFASMNGVSPPPGIDISSVAQNNALMQSLPEATRQSYQIRAAAAAAQAAQQKKNFRVSEEGKTGGSDSSTVDEGKKGLAGKSITFSRPDLTDSTTPGPPRTTTLSAMQNAMATMNVSNSQLQSQVQYQPQQMMQFQKHHQQQQQQLVAAAGAARNKPPPATGNGSVYSDHMGSSAPAAAKYPNGVSAFPQNLAQSGGGTPAQSPQWKNPVRTSASQVPSPLASSSTSSAKNLPQQQARTQQNHTQISFGATQKSTPPPLGQQVPTSHQAPSQPMVIGSPPTSLSKGGGGSPRTTTTSSSAANKAAQPSTLSSQPPKNSVTVPSRKSSPAGSRNVPSILTNPHITNSSNANVKPQMQQQQQQQQQKQQPQLFFSNAYMQSQTPHSTSSSSASSVVSGYYFQRRQPEQPQQSQLPPQQGGSQATSSTGMLSHCTTPVSLANSSTSDAKAVVATASAAATASNTKGGGSITSQGILHSAQFTAQSTGNAHQLVPPGFSIVHAVPSPVHVKPVEQKQPAGNDNLNACSQPEKK